MHLCPLWPQLARKYALTLYISVVILWDGIGYVVLGDTGLQAHWKSPTPKRKLSAILLEKLHIFQVLG